MAGTAKSVRVIGKGDKERLVPLPEAFGAVFGFWLKDRAPERVRVRPHGGAKAGVRAGGAGLPAGDAEEGRDREENHPTNCAILTPPTCSTPGPSWWTSRRCWGTRASAPPRFTPTSGRSGWSRWWRGCESQGRMAKDKTRPLAFLLSFFHPSPRKLVSSVSLLSSLQPLDRSWRFHLLWYRTCGARRL